MDRPRSVSKMLKTGFGHARTVLAKTNLQKWIENLSAQPGSQPSAPSSSSGRAMALVPCILSTLTMRTTQLGFQRATSQELTTWRQSGLTLESHIKKVLKTTLTLWL